MSSYPAFPGPHGLPILGNLRQMNQDRLAFMMSNCQQYGDVVQLQLLGIHAYQVNRPDYIQEILVHQADKFHKGPGLKRVGKATLGTGLLTSEDAAHKRQRQLVQPSFHHARIAAYGDVMVDHTLRMLERWQGQPTVNIDREMNRLTLGIVAKTLFDADVSDDADEIGTIITRAIHVASAQVTKAGLFNWLPTRAKREREEGIAKLNSVIYGFIEERRRSGVDKGDLLSMLLLSVDEQGGMSTRQARDEAMTLFIAGHETTANALAWTWYLLAQHPAVEAKLHQELDAVLAGRAPTAKELANLPYTEMIIKESMRLYPPAWLMSRRAVSDVTIDGKTFPKGTIFLMSQYVMHHDARYFPDPDAFLPERFTADFEKNLPRYAYFPFGAGPRICIGNGFAMMEARLILATMAQRYQFALTTSDKVETEPLITLRPKQPIVMRVTERQPVAVMA
ncbi:MAG: cytochrome P450 [Anaerolineae bacterium]|nr:cytochrome P450 [Anaerolineae bacterium]